MVAIARFCSTCYRIEHDVDPFDAARSFEEPSVPRRFLHRHQPAAATARWLKAGFGATIAFVLIWVLGDTAGVPFILAPLGASAVLVFGIPESPLSQPANVLGGHAIAAAISLAVDHLHPGGPIVLAATVGGVIALLGLVRLTHPPAGATALVVMLTHPDWPFLFTPVMAGSLVLVLVAVIVHAIPPRLTYPLPIPERTPPKLPEPEAKIVLGQVLGPRPEAAEDEAA
jgi:CBS-domain-containing membrane protein